MTNEQKYKTAEKRVKAFDALCKAINETYHSCIRCKLYDSNRGGGSIHKCFARWLALEAEDEKLEPCPFCHKEVVVGFSENIHKEKYRQVWCKDTERCGYECVKMKTGAEAIAAHNRVARAVRAANGSEVKK